MQPQGDDYVVPITCCKRNGFEYDTLLNETLVLDDGSGDEATYSDNTDASDNATILVIRTLLMIRTVVMVKMTCPTEASVVR